MRTPAKAPLALPSRALAEAIAAEWQAQGETHRSRHHAAHAARQHRHRPRRAAPRRRRGRDRQICRRPISCAIAPRIRPSWSARQHAAWQPLLDWAAQRYDAPLAVTAGILPIDAARREPRRARSARSRRYDAMALAALNLATAALRLGRAGAGAARGTTRRRSRLRGCRSSTRASRSSNGARTRNRRARRAALQRRHRRGRALPGACCARLECWRSPTGGDISHRPRRRPGESAMQDILRQLEEKRAAARSGRRRAPHRRAARQGQAHRARAARSAARSRLLRGMGHVRRASLRPISAWTSRRSRATAWSPATAPINGRLVFVFSQDFTVFGGSLSRGPCREDLQDHGPGDEGRRAGRSASTIPAARASRKASPRSPAMPRCSSATCWPRAWCRRSR